MADNTRENGEIIDRTVNIRRCAATVKGGRRFTFTALVVVGDGKGNVAWGYGAANEVPPSINKAIQDGVRKLAPVSLDFATDPATNATNGTIPHAVEGVYGGAHVRLLPASPGTGVIAGGAVRAVCEVAGITDILTKSFGSATPTNLVKATIVALKSLRSKEEVEKLRGVKL